MPWTEASVLEQRMRFIAAALAPDANRRAVCRAFGISPKTGYKWLSRFASGGAADGLREVSRRPQRSPRQSTPAVEQAVLELRQEFGWAGRKLRPLLAARGHVVAPATIDRIIRRHGLTDLDERHRPAPQRFTAPHPNALWQMDFKGQYPVREGWTFPFSVLDDHSRFAVGLAALSGTAGAPVLRVLQACFEQYGVPDAILCDHGVPWWHAVAGHGLTRVGVFLLEQDIRVIHSGVAHPQTQGKVERFHRTLARRLRQWGVPSSHADFPETLVRFRTEYNEIRPHAALAERPPATCYRPSLRAFQRDPTPWSYPADQFELRVNANGEIHYDHRRFFVSDALATKTVGCHQMGSRVLVRFRNHYVREIDLPTGRTRSLISQPASPMS